MGYNDRVGQARRLVACLTTAVVVDVGRTVQLEAGGPPVACSPNDSPTTTDKYAQSTGMQNTIEN